MEINSANLKPAGLSMGRKTKLATPTFHQQSSYADRMVPTAASLDSSVKNHAKGQRNTKHSKASRPRSTAGIEQPPLEVVEAAQIAASKDAEAAEAQCAWSHNAGLALEGMLKTVYSRLQPSPMDDEHRLDVINRINRLIQAIDSCQGGLVVPFGSFESKVYSPWGDLDLSLELPIAANHPKNDGATSKSRKGKVLRDVFHSLRRSGMASNLELIAGARVPLVMFKDVPTGIACDISVDNDGGCLKSRVLRWISEMDERCRQLIFLVKCWAKAQNINDPKQGTLNSYALSHLVVFHLQTRSPPILPPLREILSDGEQRAATDVLSNRAMRDQFMEACQERITRLKEAGYGKDNKSSVAQLFASFFAQYGRVHNLWKSGLAACTYSGKWGDSTSTCREWVHKDYHMTVEDPFDCTQNCARSVQHGAIDVVCEAFCRAANALASPLSEPAIAELRTTLFLWPQGAPRPGVRPWPGQQPRPPYQWRQQQEQAYRDSRMQPPHRPYLLPPGQRPGPSQTASIMIPGIRQGAFPSGMSPPPRGGFPGPGPQPLLSADGYLPLHQRQNQRALRGGGQAGVPGVQPDFDHAHSAPARMEQLGQREKGKNPSSGSGAAGFAAVSEASLEPSDLVGALSSLKLEEASAGAETKGGEGVEQLQRDPKRPVGRQENGAGQSVGSQSDGRSSANQDWAVVSTPGEQSWPPGTAQVAGEAPTEPQVEAVEGLKGRRKPKAVRERVGPDVGPVGHSQGQRRSKPSPQQLGESAKQWVEQKKGLAAVGAQQGENQNGGRGKGDLRRGRGPAAGAESQDLGKGGPAGHEGKPGREEGSGSQAHYELRGEQTGGEVLSSEARLPPGADLLQLLQRKGGGGRAPEPEGAGARSLAGQHGEPRGSEQAAESRALQFGPLESGQYAQQQARMSEHPGRYPEVGQMQQELAPGLSQQHPAQEGHEPGNGHQPDANQRNEHNQAHPLPLQPNAFPLQLPFAHHVFGPQLHQRPFGALPVHPSFHQPQESQFRHANANAALSPSFHPYALSPYPPPSTSLHLQQMYGFHHPLSQGSTKPQANAPLEETLPSVSNPTDLCPQTSTHTAQISQTEVPENHFPGNGASAPSNLDGMVPLPLEVLLPATAKKAHGSKTSNVPKVGKVAGDAGIGTPLVQNGTLDRPSQKKSREAKHRKKPGQAAAAMAGKSRKDGQHLSNDAGTGGNRELGLDPVSADRDGSLINDVDANTYYSAPAEGNGDKKQQKPRQRQRRRKGAGGSLEGGVSAEPPQPVQQIKA